MPQAATHVDVGRLRAFFPSLTGETVFLENAGGSQVPGIVADAVGRFMRETNVQRGCGYRLSERVGEIYERAHAVAEALLGAGDTGRCALGASTSALMRMLADCYADVLLPGDEIVVSEAGHEANVGPWVRLERFGATIRFWPVDRASRRTRIEDLAELVGPRTRVIAFPHVSNVLGDVVDPVAVAEIARPVGARVVVDGVAYAPHAAVDARAYGCDWYVASLYKVFGPHLSALFGAHEAFAELTGPNHFFIPSDAVPYKFELGAAAYELCAGVAAMGDYFRDVASLTPAGAGDDRANVVAAFGAMEACERAPAARLLDYLRAKPGVRMISPEVAPEHAVGIVSFVHGSLPSAAIARAAWERQIGIRNGSMYANRLIGALGLDPEDGVVRVSLAHYNTLGEIDRLIQVFEETLP